MPDYFTLAELRALPHMSDTAKYPEADVEAAAAYIVGIIEREIKTSFITRIRVDEPHNGNVELITLDDIYPRALLSVTEDGAAVVGAYLDTRLGTLRRSTTGGVWARGRGNILVTYEAGYSSAPPPDIKRAALKGTRLELLSSAADSSSNARRTSVSTDAGTESYVVAGEDRPTGYPEVDAVILGWQKRAESQLGFA